MSALPPGPPGPSLLHALHWVRRPTEFLEECARRYGEWFTLRFPWLPPFVLVSDPEAVREIFAGDPDLLRAGEANALLGALLGQHSLILLDGARHARERRLMTAPFHGERMEAYATAMRQAAHRSIDAWPVEPPFPLHARMQEITLEVILRAVFGLEGASLEALRDRIVRLLALGRSALVFVPALRIDLGPLTTWGRILRLAREIDRLLFAEIARRRARAGGNGGGEDVLSLLIAARDDHGEPMTDQELRDELITLLFAGHETTATLLTWVVARLLDHSDVLATARAEVQRVVGDGPVAARHGPALAYLDAVIKETARLTPIIPIVGRKLRAPARIGGRELPAGAIVAPCIHLVHRRADVWADPARFDPGRFLGARPGPSVYFPFGGGPRRCLGMAFASYEMKVVLAEVLARVDLRPAPGYVLRPVWRAVTLTPARGLPVIATAVRPRAAGT